VEPTVELEEEAWPEVFVLIEDHAVDEGVEEIPAFRSGEFVFDAFVVDEAMECDVWVDKIRGQYFSDGEEESLFLS